MRKIPKLPSQTLWRRGMLTSIAALSLFLIFTSTALAGSVKISDQAKVLDDDKVRNAASSLQYPLSIYTVDNYDGSTSSFDQRSKKHVTSDSIVISISTNLKRMAINAGKNVPLSEVEADRARKSFTNQYNANGDYTSATISCIDSLRNTLRTSNASTSASKDGFNFLGLAGGCLIGLIILGALFYLIIRSRRKHHGVPPPPPYVNPHYGQPYPPNNYGSNYGHHHHDHHHSSRHSGGLNPLVAGGLGAAAGGLIGYELGKAAGEHEAQHDQGGNYDDNAGNFGGGSVGDFGDGDFGGGASGDFGDGSSDIF
jgi:hypothetical protein